MNKIALKDLKKIDDNTVGDGLILEEDGIEKYVILKVADFSSVNKEGKTMLKPLGIKFVTNGDFDLSEEEFEHLKEQIIEALEDNLKPVDRHNLS